MEESHQLYRDPKTTYKNKNKKGKKGYINSVLCTLTEFIITCFSILPADVESKNWTSALTSF